MRTFALIAFWLYVFEMIFRFSYVALNIYPRSVNQSRLGDLFALIVLLYLGVWGWILLWG